MQVSRVVKISVNDQNAIWKDISKFVFSDFIFRIPSYLTTKTFKEDGAYVLPEFVPESKSLLEFAQTGCDPYERPYLYMYIVKVKSNYELPEPVVHSIQHWIAEATMVGMQWCVFIFQEENSFFDTAKQINRAFLVPEPSLLKNVVVIQCKRKMKLADQSVEMIRATIRFALIESFGTFEDEVRSKISHLQPRDNPAKLKSWRALLLFYYGFTEDALIEFLDTYYSLLPLLNEQHLNNLKIINPNFITNYPFDNESDLYSIAYFSLHGAMSVHYTRTRFSEVIELFLSHLGYLSELCENRKQMLLVEEWAEESMKVLLSIPDFSSTQNISTQLLERLYYLQIQRNSVDAGSTRTKLLSSLPLAKSYRRDSVDAKYVKWADIHGMPLPSFHPNLSFWKCGIRALNIYLDNAISNSRKEDVEKYANVLLNDKSSYEDKNELIGRLNQLPMSTCLVNSFGIKSTIESSSFGGSVQQGTVVIVSTKIKFPSWFKQSVSTFEIEIAHTCGISQTETIYSPNFSQPLIIHTYFMFMGQWSVKTLRVKVGKISFEWPINDFFNQFEVVHLEAPKVDIQMPVLTSLWKSMKIGITADFVNILNSEITMALSFSSDSIKIPEQKGKALVDGNSAYYKYDGEGKITFSTNKDEIQENPMSLSQHKIQLQLDFQIEKQTETSDIIILTNIGEIHFEQHNQVSFKFPIECTIRLQTEEFIHICLHNTSDINLTIESAEVMPDSWSKMELNSGGNIFLLARHTPNTESILNVFISEPLGSSIANSWDLRTQTVGMPTIPVVLSDSVLVEGEPTELTIELPECAYQIKESSDLVISGMTKKTFKGGKTSFTLIPLHPRRIKLPDIVINGVAHSMIPMFLDVQSSNVPVLTPLVSQNVNIVT